MFNANLISTTKLIDSSQCHLTFTNSKCLVLQNHTSRMIGSADRLGNLFVLQAQASPISQPSTTLTYNSVNSTSSDLWHKRLGHPSCYVRKTLSCIFSDITYIDNKGLPCHFCHLAKHKRPPYVNSTSTILMLLTFCTLRLGVLPLPPVSPINDIFSLWLTITLASFGSSL